MLIETVVKVVVDGWSLFVGFWLWFVVEDDKGDAIIEYFGEVVDAGYVVQLQKSEAGMRVETGAVLF